PTCLLAIRTPEPRPEHDGSGWWPELREGLQTVRGQPLLRSIAGCTATSNLFGAALQALLVLYATRELGLPPVLLGLALSAASVGALLGALLAGWVARRIGVGWS